MALTQRDIVCLRLQAHAHRHCRAAVRVHPLGQIVFSVLGERTQKLRDDAHRVIAELSDDAAPRRAREAADPALRRTIVGALDRLFAAERLAATNLQGEVIDPERVAKARDFTASFLPDGQASALAEGPDRLIEQARTVIKGLAGFTGTEPLIAAIEAAIARLAEALGHISREQDELAEAYTALYASRTAADTAYDVARKWTIFAASYWPDAGIDPRVIFPPLNPDRATEADLDKAGVGPTEPETPEAPAAPEPA